MKAENTDRPATNLYACTQSFQTTDEKFSPLNSLKRRISSQQGHPLILSVMLPKQASNVIVM